MEFNVEKEDFLKVLQRVQGIVEKRNTMPILANVHLEAEGSEIIVAATDLELFIKDSCAATVKTSGTVTVNARKLFEIVKELPQEFVDIKSGEGEKITIKSGRSRFNVMGIAASEFPAFPDTEEKNLVRIEAENLREMIEKTAFAVSTDETRYNINGFLLAEEDKTVRLVATDGHRLAIVEREAGTIPSAKEGVILPRKGVHEMKKLLEEKDGTFLFGVTKKSATMKKDATIINTRLIEGEFPDFKQILPKDNDKEVIAERRPFLEALKRVSILSADKIKGVKFSLAKDTLTLSSSSPEIGDATEEISVEYKGEDLEMAFNARYFIDVLEAIEEEKVSVKLKDQQSPGILSPVGYQGYTYIVMPMRL